MSKSLNSIIIKLTDKRKVKENNLKKINIAQKVEELISPVADELGYVIWDTEYLREGGRTILRITIDKDGGVGIDDCERFHRAIDPLIDEADPIEESYTLEVSSPGIEREIKYEWHFEACVGDIVEVHLYSAIDGQKTVIGKLLPLEETINIQNGESIIKIPRKNAAKVNLYFDMSTIN